MSKHEEITIEPELLQALRADAACAPGAAVQARVFAGIEKRLALLAAPAAVAASTATAAAHGAASASSALPLAEAASPVVQSLLAGALSKPIGIALVSAAVGGTGTYALSEYTRPVEASGDHAYSAPAPARPPMAPAGATPRRLPMAPPPVASPATTRRDDGVRRAGRAPALPQSAHRAPARPAPPSPGTPSLSEQQALLDTARRALAQGETQAVLETLGAHSSRYPNSDLAEEREALAIKALIAAGQYAAARVSSNGSRAACSRRPWRRR
jgi:hypothetical protein